MEVFLELCSISSSQNTPSRHCHWAHILGYLCVKIRITIVVLYWPTSLVPRLSSKIQKQANTNVYDKTTPWIRISEILFFKWGGESVTHSTLIEINAFPSQLIKHSIFCSVFFIHHQGSLFWNLMETCHLCIDEFSRKKGESCVQLKYWDEFGCQRVFLEQ